MCKELANDLLSTTDLVGHLLVGHQTEYVDGKKQVSVAEEKYAGTRPFAFPEQIDLLR